MSDLAESQRNRENNDLQDLFESLVARYLYPWLKPDISVSKKLDLGDYAILDEYGMEQCRQDLDFDWADSLDLEDSISKILEEQYAILTGDGDEVPFLLYSVQNQAEQSTPVKVRKTKTSSLNSENTLPKHRTDFPESEIYGLIDSDLSSEEKVYDILLSLLDEYVLVTEEDLLSQKTHPDTDASDNRYQRKPLVTDLDSPWRFSGLCIEMESVVADEEDKCKMFTGFLKNYLPSYEVIDEELDSADESSENLNSTLNEDNEVFCARRKIRFSDDMVINSGASCSRNEISVNESDITPSVYFPLYSVDSLDSGFSSDELQSSVMHFDKAVGSPDNQEEMLSPLPDSWELPHGESMIPFWLQEDDEAQVLPTSQIFSYSKDRIKGTYKVYWVEGERVVQFTDSDDEIFQNRTVSQDMPEDCESTPCFIGNQGEEPFMGSSQIVETPSVKHRPSFHRISELHPANPTVKKLFDNSVTSTSLDTKHSIKTKSRKQSTGIQTLPAKVTCDTPNASSEEAVAKNWSLTDFKPIVYILHGTLSPRKVLVGAFIPFGIMSSWLGFKFMTGQM